MRTHLWLALVGALLLSGCGIAPKIEGAGLALKQGIVFLKETHFKVAMANEEIRCKRSIELVLKLADARGEDWFTAYLASCPNLQAFLQRMIGMIALQQGFQLTPRMAPPK